MGTVSGAWNIEDGILDYAKEILGDDIICHATGGGIDYLVIHLLNGGWAGLGDPEDAGSPSPDDVDYDGEWLDLPARVIQHNGLEDGNTTIESQFRTVRDAIQYMGALKAVSRVRSRPGYRTQFTNMIGPSLLKAEKALVGDSSDEEHDALRVLAAAVRQFLAQTEMGPGVEL